MILYKLQHISFGQYLHNGKIMIEKIISTIKNQKFIFYIIIKIKIAKNTKIGAKATNSRIKIKLLVYALRHKQKNQNIKLRKKL